MYVRSTLGEPYVKIGRLLAEIIKVINRMPVDTQLFRTVMV